MSVDDDQPRADSAGFAERDSELARNVQAKVGDIANRWLKDRFGLREDGDGTLRLGDAEVIKDLAGRADQFLRGFFKGFIETPTTSDGEGRAPSVSELMTGLLARTGQTVNHAFQGYLRDHAVDTEHPGGPVVLDARFVIRHGAPLIGRIVQALGGALGGTGPRTSDDRDAVDDAPEIDVKLELPEVFKTLLSGLAPSDGDPARPAAGRPADESEDAP